MWIRKFLATGSGFYLVFFGRELADSILLWSASLKGTGRCRWSLWAVVLIHGGWQQVEEFLPVIDVVAYAGCHSVGDDVRVSSFLLSFVDSSNETIQLRVVNVFDVAEPTKEPKPRFVNAIADSHLVSRFQCMLPVFAMKHLQRMQPRTT